MVLPPEPTVRTSCWAVVSSCRAVVSRGQLLGCRLPGFCQPGFIHSCAGGGSQAPLQPGATHPVFRKDAPKSIGLAPSSTGMGFAFLVLKARLTFDSVSPSCPRLTESRGQAKRAAGQAHGAGRGGPGGRRHACAHQQTSVAVRTLSRRSA